MSQAEIQRFAADTEENQELLRELLEGVVALNDLVERARAEGYEFTVEEVKEYSREHHHSELTDEKLKAVAGGATGAIIVDPGPLVVGGEATALLNAFVHVA